MAVGGCARSVTPPLIGDGRWWACLAGGRANGVHANLVASMAERQRSAASGGRDLRRLRWGSRLDFLSPSFARARVSDVHGAGAVAAPLRGGNVPVCGVVQAATAWWFVVRLPRS